MWDTRPDTRCGCREPSAVPTPILLRPSIHAYWCTPRDRSTAPLLERSPCPSPLATQPSAPLATPPHPSPPRYTSHEVFIDDAQLAWFEKTIVDHPASEGWRIFVFSHAPIIGSGLRVLQECHVVNGCCWLNHNDGVSSKRFIQVRLRVRVRVRVRDKV